MSQTAEQSSDWQENSWVAARLGKGKKNVAQKKNNRKRKKKRKVTATVLVDPNKEDNP